MKHHRTIILALLLAAFFIAGLCACQKQENQTAEGTTKNRDRVKVTEGTSEMKEMENVIVDTAVAGDIEMDYCRFGSGSKILIILPGLSVKAVTPSADTIAQGFAEFTEEYTVYLFDRRSNIPESYSIDEMAQDTATIMKSLNIEKADIFGASQGGMITLSLAIQYPEMIHKIVLGSSAARSNEMIESVLNQWIQLAKEKKGYELNQAISEKIYSKGTYEAYKDILLAAGNDITDAEMDRFVIMASAISGLNLYDSLDQIKCDALVLGCDGDKVTGVEASKEIAEKLNCQSYIYGEEYGHAVFDEAPDYRHRILEFLTK